MERKLYMLLEIPKGTCEKYEYEKESGKLILDRITELEYPANYGQLFFKEKNKGTLSEDGDELDVLSLGKIMPIGVIIPIRLLGVLKMKDGGKRDDKLIAVNTAETDYKNIKELEDLPLKILKKIEFFFDNYKEEKTKEKKINILGWGKKEEAYKFVKEAENLFEVEKNKKK